MSVDAVFWRGRRVLVTGHTGFKGSWLSLWLQSLGAEVHGYALSPPTTPNLYTEARVDARMASSTLADVRDLAALQAAMRACQPEVVIHMAAQPLVRASYADPVTTYATNVMGTVYLLEAVRQVGSARAVVNVTTDKCYENAETLWGFRESEPMGGHDPYSNSKGCSELVTSAYRRSFFAGGPVAVGSARAGNVIGGGDWAQDRLVPDILRAFEGHQPVVIRRPDALRPWQHVLEPLSGYLALAQHLWGTDGGRFAEAWNFGPHDDDARPVRWIVEHLVSGWGAGASWQLDLDPNLVHEATHLKLDISKARAHLGWQPRWRLATALQHTLNWHQAWLAGQDMQAQCLAQIAQYSTTSLNSDQD